MTINGGTTGMEAWLMKHLRPMVNLIKATAVELEIHEGGSGEYTDSDWLVA